MKKPGLREKLLQEGVASLNDAELLAIFLRTGCVGVNVNELAEKILLHFGSLYQVLTASQQQYKQIKGVGQAKLAQLYAVAALGRRFFYAELKSTHLIDHPQAVYQFLCSQLAHESREIFMVLFLDNQHRLISAERMFMGSLTSVEVHPREIVKEVLKLNAAAIIMAHNHPSGCAEPSQADKQITRRIQAACDLFNVRLLDHVVIGRGQWVSLADRGVI
jgi:DNA repair protein RadC